MKKNASLILLVVILFSFSCKKDSYNNAKSVSEFCSYTGDSNTHNGEIVAVTGYISKVNTYLSENRFFVYDSPSYTSAQIEVHIKNNSDKISERITKELSNSNFVKISIRGKISMIYLATNGSGFWGAFIDIDKANDIRF